MNIVPLKSKIDDIVGKYGDMLYTCNTYEVKLDIYEGVRLEMTSILDECNSEELEHYAVIAADALFAPVLTVS